METKSEYEIRSNDEANEREAKHKALLAESIRNRQDHNLRLLMRDDGCIYPYSDARAEKDNFVEVRRVGDKYIPKGMVDALKYCDMSNEEMVKVVEETPDEPKKVKKLSTRKINKMQKSTLREYARDNFGLDLKMTLTRDKMIKKIRECEEEQ